MKSGGEKGMGMEVDFPARIVRIGEIEEGGDELDEGSKEIETSRCGARMEKLEIDKITTTARCRTRRRK